MILRQLGLVLRGCAIGFCLVALQASAAPITPGNLVVLQLGDGSTTPGAKQSFLKEFTTAGALIQTIPLPTAVSGANLPFIAAANGGLSLSPDGKFIAIAGYTAVPGATGLNTANASGPGGVPRAVAIFNVTTGTIDTSTSLGDSYNGGPFVSAATTDGSKIWLSGNTAAGQEASGGVRFTNLGATTSTSISTPAVELHSLRINAGQLYSSFALSEVPLATVGVGTPVTTGQAFTQVPYDFGFTVGVDPDVYDYWFKDANTVFLASRANVQGGIFSYVFDGTQWKRGQSYTFKQPPDGNNPLERVITYYITGNVDGSGTNLYGVGDRQDLVRLTLGDSFATKLATPPDNTAFAGVAFIPVPEPSTLCLIVAGGMAMSFRIAKTASRKLRRGRT